jgi:hypothetical protein
MSQYIISPVTSYDSDKQLWETYIGKDNTNKSLVVSVWGRTKEASRDNADLFLKLLCLSEPNN